MVAAEGNDADMALDTDERTPPTRSSRRTQTRRRSPIGSLGRRPKRRTGPRSRWTYWRRRVIAILIIPALWFCWSITGALTSPGTDSTAARLAQWARFHHLGWAVNLAEKVQYEFTKPETGGTVSAIPTVAEESPAAPTPSASATVEKIPTSTAPGNLTPLAEGSVPNEGLWQPMYSVKGEVAAQATYIRPDNEHTGYLVGVVWMDPKLVSFKLHPGYQVPGGGPWAEENQIPADARSSILATFNSGFTMVDSRGGFWQKGNAVNELRPGGASMVLNDDGTLDVRAWEGGAPGAGIHTVRQNLILMVNDGELTPEVTNSQVTAEWGATIGNAAFVWRSAVGVRNDGTVIFVAGPAMNIKSLASIMKAAGCVRAMQLDINPSWTNYITYTQDNGQTTPHMFPEGAQPNAWRYLTPSTRDFVAVMPRP
jgi:uncharacterized protein YigE (DUF2233 family)